MLNKKQLQEIIGKKSWRYAKTYSSTPHSYIMLNKGTAIEKEFFDSINTLINETGYDENFYKRVYRYVNFGEYKYWLCGTKISKDEDIVVILNKTLIGNKYT